MMVHDEDEAAVTRKTAGGWEWNEWHKAWFTTRDAFVVSIKLPRQQPPPFSAALMTIEVDTAEGKR